MVRTIAPVTLLFATLAATACGGGPPGLGPDGGVLECTPPLSITLSPSTDPPNAGVPTAGIGWAAGSCQVFDDETRPEVVLVVADLTGFLSGSLSAAADNRWVIESSSVGSAPTTYIAPLPRDVTVDVMLRNRDDAGLRLALSFQVAGDVVTLLDMRRL